MRASTLLLAVSITVGCITGDPPPPAAVCSATKSGFCSCTANQDGEGNNVSCPAKGFDSVRTQCCAGLGWPDLGTCDCFSQATKALCHAGELAGACGCVADDGTTTGATTCPPPPSKWGVCCHDSSANKCMCLFDASSCPSGSLATDRCDAAKVGTSGACGIGLSGSCTCDRYGALTGTLTECGSAPKPSCCLDSSSCRCTYGTTCASTQKSVASCDAATVEATLQANPQKPKCDVSERAVESCGPISQGNPLR